MDPYDMKVQLRDELKELHRNSETRSAELQCSQEGYEYGLEDAIKLIEECL